MLQDIQSWFERRVPQEWFTPPLEVSADGEEIVVVGTLPETGGDADSDDAKAAAQAGAIGRFREESRQRRMRIAAEAEQRFGRHISWGAACGGVRQMFTTASVPMMTRLRMPERAVLDTLVEAGVARTRSDALGWCIRHVGEKEKEWLQELRNALVEVQRLRSEGPKSQAGV